MIYYMYENIIIDINVSTVFGAGEGSGNESV